jgi:hypothetical protein
VLSPVLEPRADPVDAPTYTEQKSFSTLAEGFRHHGGRVLLLGQPGAGKTTALLATARDAAVTRLHDPREPVPILLSLHDWRPAQKETLKEWSRRQVGQVDIDANRILFLFDGLDEIPPALDPKDDDPRSTFIRQFEDELRTQEVIVTTRVKDYAEIGKKFVSVGAVTLQPLFPEQIRSYLVARGIPNLWEQLQANEQLLALARVPLLLALLTVGVAAENFNARNILDADAVFDAYVKGRFRHEIAKRGVLPYDEPTTRRALSSVAGLMVALHRADLAGAWCSELVPRRLHPKVLRPEYIRHFLDWAAEMHFLENAGHEKLSFLHLKLRDWFASQGLPTLLHSRIYRRDAVVGFGTLRRRDGIPSLISVLHRRSVWSHCRDRLLECCMSNLDSIVSEIFIPDFLTGLFREIFVSRLEDSETTLLRKCAVRALGEMGTDAAVDPLVSAVWDERAKVRKAAVSALGRMRATGAVLSLIDAMKLEQFCPNRCNGCPKYWSYDARTLVFDIGKALVLIGEQAIPALQETSKWTYNSRQMAMLARSSGRRAERIPSAKLREIYQELVRNTCIYAIQRIRENAKASTGTKSTRWDS